MVSSSAQGEATVAAQSVLPFPSRWADISGYRMHYVDEGQGPVVVLLHGNPTWCYYYRNLIVHLREAFRVIAPDYIGCGLSEHPAGVHFRALDRVQQVAMLLERLGINRYSLVLHDWGGPIGTGLAVRCAEKVDKLVYFNTTLTDVSALPPVIKWSAAPVIGRFLTETTKFFLHLTVHLGAVRRLSPEVRRGYIFPYRSLRSRRAICDFVADIPFYENHPTYEQMTDIAARMPKLRDKPVKIIWGLRDLCFHRGMLERLKLHFPQAEVMELEDASHLVLEDGGEKVLSAVSEFLQRSSSKVSPGEDGASQSDAPANALYANYSAQAAERSTAPAVIVGSFTKNGVECRECSFGRFAWKVNSYQRGLAALGLRAGDRVLMLVPPGIEFLALSYAVMGRGAVPVYLDPGMGRENLKRCIIDAAPDALIGTRKAQIVWLMKRTLCPQLRFSVVADRLALFGFKNLRFLGSFSGAALAPAAPEPVCLIAFTSGGTGTPKGVIYTNDMVRAQLEIFRAVFRIEAGKKDLPLLPVFALFSLASGVCSVIAPIDPAKPIEIDPGQVAALVDKLKINYSFGSPILWGKIAEFCRNHRIFLPSLDGVFVAGAPVSREVLRQIENVAINAEAATPYGATEALPVTYVSSKEIFSSPEAAAKTGEQGTLVGKAVAGVEVRIIKLADAALDAGEMEELPLRHVGEVIVRGPNVSREYLRREEETRQAKIIDGKSFWHRMGDMGYLDERGNLYFCGRKTHMVRTEKRVYYSVPTERLFNNHPRVRRSALVSLADGSAGIVVEPYAGCFPHEERQRQMFAAELAEIARQSPLTNGISRFFFHEAFPVDARHNAKIFRDRLSVWAQTQGGP